MANADPKQPLAGLKLGDRVINARRNAGFQTRVDFCNHTKLSYSNIHKVETGQTEPTDPTLRRIAKATGYTVRELRGNSSDTPQDGDEYQVPYEAWAKFLKTEEGASADPFHLGQLSELRFTGEPTATRYVVILAMLAQPD